LIKGGGVVHTGQFPPSGSPYVPTINPDPHPEYPLLPPSPPYPEPVPRMKDLK
jgi:hypothetical protein